MGKDENKLHEKSVTVAVFWRLIDTLTKAKDRLTIKGLVCWWSLVSSMISTCHYWLTDLKTIWVDMPWNGLYLSIGAWVMSEELVP